jgi:hypothetical protein
LLQCCRLRAMQSFHCALGPYHVCAFLFFCTGNRNAWDYSWQLHHIVAGLGTMRILQVQSWVKDRREDSHSAVCKVWKEKRLRRGNRCKLCCTVGCKNFVPMSVFAKLIKPNRALLFPLLWKVNKGRIWSYF